MRLGCFILSLALIAPAMSKELNLRLVTFNIRYANTISLGNERPWSTRAPLVINQLSQTAGGPDSSAVTLIGLQEALHAQLEDIKSGLGSAWAHIGVARDDGKQSGEYSPILYKSSVLTLLYNETKWLSLTPDVPSFGWFAGSRRVVTIGVFEHITSGKRFIAANTHLDNVSGWARSEGVRVILERIKAVQAAWGPLGVSLSGDFNSEPTGEAYQALLASGYFGELYNLATNATRFGPYETYTGFLSTDRASRIDYLWVGPVTENRWVVDRYEVLNNIQGNVYLSDHRAVVGDLRLT